MTVRKLQKTGGASLSIIIPKKWAANLELTDKSQLEIDSSNPFQLKLSPLSYEKQMRVVKIDANNQTTIKVIRDVIAAYLSGCNQVIIHNLSPQPIQQTRLHNLCSSLIGFEIVEESATKLVLQNVFDVTKFPLSENLEKMFFMVATMFDDTLLALTTNNQALGLNVIQREKEIDKFHLAITRQFYVHLQNEFTPSQGYSTLELYYFGLISRQLERISDHTEKICKLIGTQKYQLSDFARLPEITGEIKKLIVDANKMTKIKDRMLTHQILDKSNHVAKKIAHFQAQATSSNHLFHTVCDSLDRICGYLTNMAEATLDQSIT